MLPIQLLPMTVCNKLQCKQFYRRIEMTVVASAMYVFVLPSTHLVSLDVQSPKALLIKFVVECAIPFRTENKLHQRRHIPTCLYYSPDCVLLRVKSKEERAAVVEQ